MNPLEQSTPRTDEAETANKFPRSTEYYAMVEHARTLERELAETERLRFGADADRRRLRCDLSDAKAEASHYMAVAQKATDELIFFRADNLKAHQMTCAAGLERDSLRAEVERLTAKIGNQADRIRYLEGATNHATGTPLSQAIARAEKAEAELAEAKVERETIAQSSLRSLEAYIDKLKQFAERAERAEAEIAEWSVLNLWGGTPDFIHEFIKGQQARIHRCQDLEADNAKWQKLLLMSRDDREIDLISEIEEQARLLGMSGEREADLLGKLGRLESELAAIKNGHGELGKYEQLRLKNAELQAELANIANAKPDTWGDMSDSFQAWAQNRARHALAAMKGTP
jgi:hypothetical protein